MRKALCSLFLIASIGSIACAEGTHRLGLGLGSINGEYSEPGVTVAMDGGHSDIPSYSYTFDKGLTLAVQLKTIDIEGTTTILGISVSTFYTLDVITFGIGYAIAVSNAVVIAPTFVIGSGAAKFHYEIPGFGSSPVIEGDGGISGIEIPIYFDIGQQFFVGLKPGFYGGGSEITYPNGDKADVKLGNGFQFLLGAKF